MSYLSRESAPLSDGIWERIDAAAVKAARRVLVGRRFLHVFGPLGIGVQSIALDDADAVQEVEQDGLLTVSGRKFAQIPTLFADFTLLARDMESAERAGLPLDLSKAETAAEACALKEDRLVFFGSRELGYDGLLTVPGAKKLKRSDWSAGESAFSDVASGLSHLAEQGIYGAHALALSPDLYMQLQRLQPGTGLLELDRVAKLVDGHVYSARVLGTGTAVLVASDAANMDLVIGQDIAAAYLEQKELNHSFRMLETALPRFKRKQAIVIFE